jgi:hypothetical protein
VLKLWLVLTDSVSDHQLEAASISAVEQDVLDSWLRRYHLRKNNGEKKDTGDDNGEGDNCIVMTVKRSVVSGG